MLFFLFLLASYYLISDFKTFIPLLVQDYLIEVIGRDMFGITQKLTYLLPVQNPVTFSALVSPSVLVVNDGSKLFRVSQKI